MKVSFFFVGVLLAFNTTKLFATPQQPDILIYEGKSYPIYGEPLETYFNRNPERRPRFCGGLSSLWRGYVAEIEVEKDKLVLKDVKIHTG